MARSKKGFQGQGHAKEATSVEALDLHPRTGPSGFARSFSVAEFHNSGTALRVVSAQDIPSVTPLVTGHWDGSLP